MADESKNFQKILDGCPTYATLSYGSFKGTGEQNELGFEKPKRVAAVFDFSIEGFGFGELTLVRDENGQMYIDTECMSKERVKSILCHIVDSAITDREEDPERHIQYHEVMGGFCRECPENYLKKNGVWDHFYKER